MADALTDQELQAIRERCERATAGPWEWAEDRFRDKYATYNTRTRRWRGRPGKSIKDTWVGLLVGPRHAGVREGYEDEWDYPHVLALRRRDVRSECLVNPMPRQSDAAFIAHARTDVPALIAEVERQRRDIDFLERLVKSYQQEVMQLTLDGIKRDEQLFANVPCPPSSGGS